MLKAYGRPLGVTLGGPFRYPDPMRTKPYKILAAIIEARPGVRRRLARLRRDTLKEIRDAPPR